MTLASLAFETSGRFGAIALGIDGVFVEAVRLPRKKRHNLELMPAVADLCAKHSLRPSDLHELYVSLGPGSFTGLRIAIATAKMLSLTTADLKLVGVPTIEVLAEQYKDAAEYVAVCLNVKRGTMYAGVYKNGHAQTAPALCCVEQLLANTPRPLAVVAEVDTGIAPGDEMTCVPRDAVEADAAVTWRLGQVYAKAGRFCAASELAPLYIREPEAVTVWRELGRG